MRRNLVIAAIAAMAACGLGASPAAAATGRPAPAAMSAFAMGTRCTIVESHSPVRTGAICVTVVRRGLQWRAEVTFKAVSGSLREVSVKNLRLLVAGGVKERTGHVLRDVSGRTDAVPSNWWEDNISGVFAQAGVYDACMVWANGARVCTGNHWFNSLRVGV
jgi:hypothetical protein